MSASPSRLRVDFTRHAWRLGVAATLAAVALVLCAAASAAQPPVLTPPEVRSAPGQFIVLAVANLRFPEVPLLATLGLQSAPASSTTDGSHKSHETYGTHGTDAALSPTEPAPITWPEVLAPRGAETRLADAVRYLINRERGGPLAGIVLVTDGGNNAGSDADAAAKVA